ncbi:MAG: DegT/DnrJ/EryC1/StrS family aminotransferase, partial [Candidatus Omnitrophica bacterium]|nr:DegT/DnrJ/EryC1/StrS family aminotransferase [Candidatus Omnitrophota bacterium]
MAIPQLDLKAEYDYLKKDISRNINACIKYQQWILGPSVKECEQSIAEYLKSRNVTGVASGTDALLLSLRAVALIKKGRAYFRSDDEIITTPFTFVATAEAIARAGAKPVFVDIDPDTYNLDPKALEKAVNKKTAGIMPVHLYGLACDMERISRVAKKNGLFIVEDCAQSFGGEYKGKKLGTFGDCGAFSFFPSKNLGSWGDAGCICTDSKKIADCLRSLRHHGQEKNGEVKNLGYNSRLDTIQAAVISAKLKYIDQFNRARKKVAKTYKQHLKGQKFITIPFEPLESSHSWALYTVRVKAKRDK